MPDMLCMLASNDVRIIIKCPQYYTVTDIFYGLKNTQIITRSKYFRKMYNIADS